MVIAWGVKPVEVRETEASLRSSTFPDEVGPGVGAGVVAVSTVGVVSAGAV